MIDDFRDDLGQVDHLAAHARRIEIVPAVDGALKLVAASRSFPRVWRVAMLSVEGGLEQLSESWPASSSRSDSLSARTATWAASSWVRVISSVFRASNCWFAARSDSTAATASRSY